MKVEIYLAPIGPGQSSVKIKFNPINLTTENVGDFLNFLKHILGHHAYRIYYEATITRYDVTYDFHGLELYELEYFVKHLGKFEFRRDENTDELTSLTFGTYGSRCYARFYNKALEMFKKTGDKKYLNQVWTRFELQIRRDIPFYELWNIENDFRRIEAFDFDRNNKSQTRNFIRLHKKNRDLRKKLVRLLKDDYLHPIIRKHFNNVVPVVCRSFKPYIEHLFPNDKTWNQERTNALSLLKKLVPPAKVVSKYKLICKPREKLKRSTNI